MSSVMLRVWLESARQEECEAMIGALALSKEGIHRMPDDVIDELNKAFGLD